jgi:putative flippase GtrA
MVELLRRKSLKENLKETGPALAILLATLVISTFITEFTFSFGMKAMWKTLLRFFRLSLLLTLPILLLPGLCTLLEGIFNRGRRRLIQIPDDRDTAVHPLKNWVIRPFQGIGLAMLLATKLLTLLEIYTGSRITLETVLPPGRFNPGRFFSSIAIGVVVSLLLSCLWTLDDLGVRHYNEKTREVKMIGKYVGLFLPVFFGFYGIISLFDDNSQVLVAKYVAQMVVILYPPFVVLNVLHSRYLKSREEVLLRRLKVARGVLANYEELAFSKD